MNNTRPFSQVDVFSERPYAGNPVAVILDAKGLSKDEMQAIANWTNLSETTFVLPPVHSEADYRLRIFTPNQEIPFAGHPTLGSAHALLESGLEPKKKGMLVQECEKGLVRLRIRESSLYFRLPEPQFADPGELLTASAAEAIGTDRSEILDASLVDVGPVWFTLQLASAEKVIGLEPDMEAISNLGKMTGITVFGAHPDGKYEVRSFAPAFGVPEDPVCGSGNGCVAAMVRRNRLISPHSYVALQGRRMGREGRIEAEFDEGIWIGGRSVTCITGKITA